MEPFGLILIAQTGEIVATSPAADRCVPLEERNRLAAFASHGLANLGESRVMTWPRPDTNSPWLVWVTPVRNGSAEPVWFALALLDGNPVSEATPQLIASLFHLTKAEVRLAMQVLDGKSPAEAAEEMGVTIHTVRTYLKRLYLKVGVKSQAGLTRKLLHCTLQRPPLP